MRFLDGEPVEEVRERGELEQAAQLWLRVDDGEVFAEVVGDRAGGHESAHSVVFAFDALDGDVRPGVAIARADGSQLLRAGGDVAEAVDAHAGRAIRPLFGRGGSRSTSVLTPMPHSSGLLVRMRTRRRLRR